VSHPVKRERIQIKASVKKWMIMGSKMMSKKGDQKRIMH